jgi:DNA processing protein
MAALGNAALIVEGKERSGALITARIAKRLGLEVFAVPGPITQATSKAPNQLIADGAHVAMEAIDILEQFLDVYGNTINISASKEKPKYKVGEIYEPKPKGIFKIFSKKSKKADKPSKIEEKIEKTTNLDLSALTPTELEVYNFMQAGIEYNYDMFEEIELSVPALSATISNLEIKKAVSPLPGGRYIKNI